jgi:hypothetical protein
MILTNQFNSVTIKKKIRKGQVGDQDYKIKKEKLQFDKNRRTKIIFKTIFFEHQFICSIDLRWND